MKQLSTENRAKTVAVFLKEQIREKRYFGIVSLFIFLYLTIGNTSGLAATLYSYQTGSWNTATTWTTDPSATTQVGGAVPANGDIVVILSGRTVSLPADVATTGLDITIESGGFLDLSTFSFTNTIKSLQGQGIFKLASVNFPTVTTNNFVNADGGTVEYYNGADFTLPTSQTTYNNLTINCPSYTATQLSNITLNGNLDVKKGTFRINNNASTTRRILTINGNVTVDANASITVGQRATNTTTNPTNISGGEAQAPFTNYYEQFHRVVIYGDFINNGTVRFTNLAHPVYNQFPPRTNGNTTAGAASVYFRGDSDNTLICNGSTDFYNLILDKGVDQTYSLTIKPSIYSNFRLFGANNAASEDATSNPLLRKALWIRTGTLKLTGQTVIPSLTEGTTTGTGDYIIPINGALVIDGPDVKVLTTADKYEEVNVAYGLTGGSNAIYGVTINAGETQSLSIYGKCQIDDGYISTRESGGIILPDIALASGQIKINGGKVDAKQLRSYRGASFEQTGGLLQLRGGFQATPATVTTVDDFDSPIITTRAVNGINIALGTFNINDAANAFIMSGGTMKIYDVCGNTAAAHRALYVNSSVANNNVTAGTIEIIPTNGTVTPNATAFTVFTTSSLYNLTINNASPNTATTQLRTNPLTVLNNLAIQNGTLNANNLDVTIGGNFSIENGANYTTGTNWTTFNGVSNQTFTINTAGAVTMNKLKIDKLAGVSLILAGSQKTINVADALTILKGTLADGGATLNFTSTLTTSTLYNSGIHSGIGKISLSGTNPQIIDGDGTGIFQNLELNNNNASTAPISLSANATMNGVLTFSRDKLLNISSYNLKFNAGATIANASATRYIQTGGNSGDGGVTFVYPSATDITFPVGAASTNHVGVPKYTPATIGFTGTPTILGNITVIPVGYEHPNTTVNGYSLTYFWKVKSSGFTLGSATVKHSYQYDQLDVKTGSGILESEYVSARYDITNYTWKNGTATDVDDITNKIDVAPSSGNFPAAINFIDGDYTAGDNSDGSNNPFGTVKKFYSRTNGDWNTATTWSNTGHTGGVATNIPSSNDAVIIGNGNNITLSAPSYSASLQIATGSSLDILTYTTSNFGVVLNHSTNSNGKVRVRETSASPSLFTFPSGDFTDYNVNKGTTEFYTSTNKASNIYILPANVTSYGNLILSPNGLDNLSLPNNSLTTIYGDLTLNSVSYNSWIAMSWNTTNWGSNIFNPTIEKTVHIVGNLYINGGTLEFMDDYAPQHLVVDGDVIVANTTNARIDCIENGWLGGGVMANTFSIGGSLINNSIVRLLSTTKYCNLTFNGSNSASITNTTGTPTTIFNKVTVNKGTSQATTLTLNIGGTLETPTDNWLTLRNGTLKYMRTNPNSDFTISTTSPFTIPSTAGFYVDYANSGNRNILIGNSASNTNDLYLQGDLTVVNGTVYVGPTDFPNRNNDIEYSAGGASSINIQGGNLFVNGQIRRNPATSNGILSYTQSGGNLFINGNSANTTNAKLEVLNSGSRFDMSGGIINIVRGGGGTSYGDLYLRPENSVVTGGEIIFSQEPSVDAVQNYTLDANVPLNNLTIKGKKTGTDRNAYVKLLISPLQLNGTLKLSNNRSIFDANIDYNIPVSIKGDLDNSGTYNHYNNTTTFNGDTQSIKGTTATDFYDLNVNPITSLSIIRSITVNHNLSLGSGQLIGSTFFTYVKGDIKNNATYTGDNVTGGVVLNGSTEQLISGTGTFGRLELNNASGAKITNDITLQQNLKLTNGVLDINKYLFTLGVSSAIEGTGFGSTKMIASDGVFSNVGIKKIVSTGNIGTFIFPIGCAGKYSPAELTITSNTNVGYVRLNAINSKHPATLSPYRVLDYYWEVESSGINGLNGNLVLNYLTEDIMTTATDETNYVAARLIVPGTSWSKAATGAGSDNVAEATNKITFTFSNTNNLSGEYTAGLDSDIPLNVPTYRSNKIGNWQDNTIWTPENGSPACPTGGPNGFIVIVDHEVTANSNYCFAYRTTINDKLKIQNGTIGHNLGTVDGDGTLYLENSVFPAGRYTSFLDCSSNSTLEYGGTTSYTIISDLYNSVPNLTFSGSSNRFLPDADLTICKQLKIDGPTLDNTVYGRKLTIKGSFIRNAGNFVAGTGSNATVSFEGTTVQAIGGTTNNFNGTNAFNNFEINNSNGITIDGPTEIKGNLLLTNGLINTSSTNTLAISNTSNACVVPIAGSASSFVNGPLTKKINAGDTFTFPIGKGTQLGSKLNLSASTSGTIDWSAEYYNSNPTYTNKIGLLTAVNANEYWTISAPSSKQAIVNIDWDDLSDITPLMTENGLADMRVTNYTSSWEEIPSSAIGNNNNGTVSTTFRVTIPASGTANYTTACVNTTKPKAKFTPGNVCGLTTGIPVEFTYSGGSIPLNYSLTYSINGVIQAPVTVTAVPYFLPTPTIGVYKLISFTYSNGTKSGVVDLNTVTVYASPTTSIAGPNQSNCGLTTATLSANAPTVGTGLWSITSGAGGTVTAPTSNTSSFNGTNGSAYTLKWTITNGTCISESSVNVSFPLLPIQPSAFTQSDTDVCAGESNITYTVPNDLSATYIWSYSGTNATIVGTGNSITMNFASNATSGTLSVVAQNGCGDSAPRTIAIAVHPQPVVTLASNDTDNLICIETSVIFTATENSGTTITNWEFFIDGISVQSGISNTYTTNSLTDGAEVTVTGATADGCSNTSTPITITLNSTEGIWIGAVDSNWDTPANWCSNSVPASNSNITITNGANKAIITGTRIINNLTIDAGAELTVNQGAKVTVNGDIINNNLLRLKYRSDNMSSFINYGTVIGTGNTSVDLTLADDAASRIWYLGHAVNTNSNAYFSAGLDPLKLVSYNSVARNFEVVPANTTMANAMQGYAMRCNTINVIHTGALHSGTQSFPLVTTGDKWNLVANPYPSYIDFKKSPTTDLDYSKINPTIWVRTKEGGYQFLTFNIALGTGVTGFDDGIISPMQAFWVYANGSNGDNFRIFPSARTNNPTNTLKGSNTDPNDVLRFTLSNAKASDEAILVFRNIGNLSYTNIDSEKKPDSYDYVPYLYSKKGTKNIVISALPSNPIGNSIPLAFKVGTAGAGNLTFKCINIDEFMPDVDVFLVDKDTGIKTNLRETDTYEFTATATTEKQRFNIEFASIETPIQTEIDETKINQSNNQILVDIINSGIQVTLPDEVVQTGGARIKVMTVSGQTITSIHTDKKVTDILLDRVEGYIMVTVDGVNASKTAKLFLKKE